MTNSKHTSKLYRCTQCGNTSKQTTNHYGNTWSAGRYNTCSKCPPFKKYPLYGGQTVWECLDNPPTSGRNVMNDLKDNYYSITGEELLDD